MERSVREVSDYRSLITKEVYIMRSLFMMLVMVMVMFFPRINMAQNPTTVLVDINHARIAWDWERDPNSGMAEAFEVRCGSQSGNYTNVYEVGVDVRDVAINRVVQNVGMYYCVVVAKNRFGVSPPSNEISFTAGTIPSSPANLRIVVP